MLKRIFSGIVLTLSLGAYAQSVHLGAHVGAIGSDSGSEIGYGVHLTANPYGFAGFRVDATFADFDGMGYFSTSPAVIVYPVDFEEMKLGLIGGAGFYRFEGDKTRFGLNYGAVADFMLARSFSVGMEARGHSVFDVPNVWTLFITAAYRFELEGAW
jgi:hypothetical protein